MAEAKKSTAAGKSDAKTPAERTKTVLVPRVNNVLDAIRVMGNCANPAAYDIKADYVKKIFVKIRSDLAAVENAFNDAAAGKTTKQVKQGFDL